MQKHSTIVRISARFSNSTNEKKIVLTLLFFVCAAPVFGQAWVHPFDFPQSKNCPQEVMAVVEIPAGSFIKYELDKTTGHVVVDRFQSVPMVYPANYGTLTQTLAGDGDNLDVLIYTRAPVQSGALILVRHKTLPAGRKKVELGGIASAEIARNTIRSAVAEYAKAKKLSIASCNAKSETAPSTALRTNVR